jgi:hypothetical protein
MTPPSFDATQEATMATYGELIDELKAPTRSLSKMIPEAHPAAARPRRGGCRRRER